MSPSTPSNPDDSPPTNAAAVGAVAAAIELQGEPGSASSMDPPDKPGDLGPRFVLRYIAILMLFDLVSRAMSLPVSRLLAGSPDVAWRRALMVTAPMAVVWLITLAVLLRPVSRWLAAERLGPSRPELLVRAAVRLQRMPLLVPLASAVQWGVSLLVLANFEPHFDAWATLAFLIGAFVAGPFGVGFLVVGRFSRRATRGFSTIARARGVHLPPSEVSLHRGLLLVALAVSVTPASYMSAVALAATTQHWTSGELKPMALGFILSSAISSTIAALLMARSIASPVEEITEMVHTISRRGDVSQASALPLYRSDELGQLAVAINAMVARLAQTEVERAAIGQSLAVLNRTLERRVEERTARLEAANASLESEMHTRLLMEAELRQAQKLESVGRLAAGVAHEINTPVQFVSDSIAFVCDASRDLMTLVTRQQELLGAVNDASSATWAIREAERAREELDFDYLAEQVPRALERSVDGLLRVATIVRSMKEFAHPDRKEMSAVDLNRAIDSTLVIARNEYKYVADVETDFGELPLVTCHGGDINQVVLNIVVNAAHAISDVVAGTDHRGRITVRTRAEGELVCIEIADTGGGIPEAIRERIFDPFFTTKEVGRGTGQGLAIARTVVTDRHGGSIDFTTELGRGTTFCIRLPIHGRAAAEGRHAA